MGQHRKTGAGNGSDGSRGSHSRRGALRARQPAHFARHLATAALISAGLPFNVALAADAPSAAESSARKSYDIPAGPLEAVLNRFGRESGLLLSFPAALTDGRTSEGLHGDYNVPQGFDRILRGTGLGAVQQSNGSYTLVPRAEPAADSSDTHGTILPAVTVSSTMVKAGSYRPPVDAVVTRSDTPVLDTAQAVNIVPSQVLHDQHPRNLDDALANVSGIVQGNTLAGTQDTLLKRGFGGNRDGSIMHNGMPLVQGRALNAAADSVEVLKGPTSLLYGIMDPGGVVNVVSKQPLLQPYHAISVLGSTYGHGRNGAGATLDTTGPIGDSGVAYRLVVDQTDEQYWRNFGEHRETLVAPSLAWYGRDTQVVVSYEYRKFLYPFDRGTALDPKTNKPLAISSRERLDEPFNEMDGESNLAQISVDHQINPNWKAHFGYSYNSERYDAGQLRVQGINSTTGAVSRSNDATHGALSKDSYAIAYVDGHFDIAGLRNDLQVGVDAEYRRIYRKDLLRQATKYPFNYFNPIYGRESPSTTVSASDSDQTDTLHDRSFFFQDSLHLTDKWILIGGARFLSYNQIAGKGRPFVVNTDINGSKWLPRAGVVYKWTDTVSLYGSYTQSLKPTSTIAPLGSGVVIDSSVQPEEATSWELGAKVAMPNGLSGTLAIFNIDKKNVLVQQYNDTTKQVDWRTAGKARSRGVELDVAGQIGQHWSVIASYAYIDAKTTEDPLYAGKRLWNAPQNTASLAAVYDFGTIFGGDQLRVGAGAHYVGTRPGDSANSFTLPAYTVADAFATYETKLGNRHLSFQLNVKNLFNKTYYPSSANRYFVSVGDARQVSLLSTLEF
ncbi:TonB-dependent siderophore receptor [Paraburkholderia sediminicola]|uniref:TonB-dependent siderophore receptor n=1 Tax=Paraburkholderia sediminicola TaxID=458836 RepID=UPI0038B930F7